jgi:hypothetical protein
MNSYEEKQEARKEYYLEQAEKARREFEEKHGRAKQMASVIPFGQPILVGHHSEKRDRNYRDKIHNTFGKAFAALDKADYYENKAASVGKGGISSDDPEAIRKLNAELEGLEENRKLMRTANAAIRRGKTEEEKIAALVALGLSEKDAREILKPDSCGRIGFPDYQFSNMAGNMKRIKDRIAGLEKMAKREAREEKTDLYEYREDKDENRVMFFFAGKPDEAVRSILKKRGFKWAPSKGAWIRLLNNAALYAAKDVKEALAALSAKEA